VMRVKCIWVVVAWWKEHAEKVWQAWCGMGLCERLCEVTLWNVFEVGWKGKTWKENLTWKELMNLVLRMPFVHSEFRVAERLRIDWG
jgi:hypothetical protein